MGKNENLSRIASALTVDNSLNVIVENLIGTGTRMVVADPTGLLITQNLLSLTTTGISGSATLVDNVLNIPNYSLGYVPYVGAINNVNLGSYSLSAGVGTFSGLVTAATAGANDVSGKLATTQFVYNHYVFNGNTSTISGLKTFSSILTVPVGIQTAAAFTSVSARLTPSGVDVFSNDPNEHSGLRGNSLDFSKNGYSLSLRPPTTLTTNQIIYFPNSSGTVALTSDITSSIGNGTLTLNVAGSGLSGSASFTANQSGATTFTVTSNAVTAGTANTLVLRDSGGDIYTRYFHGAYHNSSDDISTGTITYIMAKFGDNYFRSATAAKVQSFLGLGSMAYQSTANYYTAAGTNSTFAYVGGSNASGTWPISISGTSTNARYVYQVGTYGGTVGYVEASSLQVYYSSISRYVYNSGAYGGTVGYIEPSSLYVVYANSSGYASSSGNADTVDGHHSSNFLGYNGTSYYQAGNWIQFNSTYGLYWPSTGAGTHFSSNGGVGTTAYGSFQIQGMKSNYVGLTLMGTLGTNGHEATLMYDMAGNGGMYNGNTWQWYWGVTNSCLGIGGSTTAPGYKAYVNGSAFASGAISAGSSINATTSVNAGTTVTATAGVYGSWIYATGNTGLYFSQYGYGLWSVDAGGGSYGNVMCYDPGKNGWKGYATDPVYTLMSNGTQFGLHDSSHSWQWYVDSRNGNFIIGGSGSEIQAGYKLQVHGNIRSSGVIYSSSIGYFGGDVYANYSDERLKENIICIENALSKVGKLRGVHYNANELALELGASTDQERRVGVIAQDFEDILPEVLARAPFDIISDEKGNIIPNGSKSGDNYNTVQYERIVPLLIEAIKELNKKVEELENK